MTAQEQLSQDEAIAGVTAVSAQRIGLIADDHNAHDDGSDLPRAALAAFDGVDLIVHLGHMGVREVSGRGVLDRLAEVAPVLAVRDYTTLGDGNAVVTPAAGDRVAGLTRVVDVAGVRIGLVHNLERGPGPAITTPPGGVPELTDVAVRDAVAEKFGVPVDVVAYASTHRAAAIAADGILFVNPGSPTYPKGPGRTAGTSSAGTVGILTVNGATVGWEVLDLSLFAEPTQ